MKSFDNIRDNVNKIKAKWQEAYDNNRKAFYINIINKRFTENLSFEDKMMPLVLLMQWNVLCKAHEMKVRNANVLDALRNAENNPKNFLSEEEIREIMSTEHLPEDEAGKILAKYSNGIHAIDISKIDPILAEEFKSYLSKVGKIVSKEEEKEEKIILN